MVQTSGTLDESGMLRLGAFLLAIEEINNKADGVADTLLPRTTLDFVLRASQRDGLAALVGALELVGSCGSTEAEGGVVAAIGAASSGPSESAAAAFAKSKVPQISYSSTSPKLSDGSESGFPFFLRTPPSDAFQAEAMVDVLSNLFNYSHVAIIKSTDSYGMEGVAAFSQLWTAQNRTILTSQSVSSAETDFSLVYQELKRVRARVVVLFCQAKEGGRFLRGAYQSGVGGPGFLVFGSDAVTSPGTWLGDDENGGLAANATLRNEVFRGFFGLTPSNGLGTARYAAYRQRLVTYSQANLPKLATAVLTGSDTASCDVAATLASSPAWNSTDADGRRIWIKPGSGGSNVCVAPANPLSDNTYSPYAYDAVYAVAHALHHLIEVKQYTSLPGGDTLMNTLLQDVSFDGVTGRVEFFAGGAADSGRRSRQRERRGLQTSQSSTLYRGDRRVGVSYAVHNFQDGSLVRVGEWTACNAKDTSCAFSQRWVRQPDSALQFSTADNARPGDVELQFCALPQHTTQIIGCDANGHAGRGMAGDRLIEFATPFGCEPRAAMPLPCHYVFAPTVWEAQLQAQLTFVAFVLAVALKLYLLVQLFRRRKDKAIKRSQPLFGAISLVGGILFDATTTLTLDEPTTLRCAMRSVWAGVTFTLFFAPITFKTFKLWLVLGGSLNRTRDNDTNEQSSEPAMVSITTKALSRRRVRSHHLTMGVMLLTGLHLAILAIHFALEPPLPTLRIRNYPLRWNTTEMEGDAAVVRERDGMRILGLRVKLHHSGTCPLFNSSYWC